jgi:pimeloyl-ACP methyl ester carboxylesterase
MTMRSMLLYCAVLATTRPAYAERDSVFIPPAGQAKYKEAAYALWMPEGVGKLRAVIMHQHGCGDPAERAGETATFDLQWQALAKKWDCALMGASYRQNTACHDWAYPENGSGPAFLQALADFGRQSGHKELAEVPWVLWGHSGGAEWAYRMFTRHADRVLALVLRSGPTFAEGTYAESLATPVLYNLGVREKGDAQFGRIWDYAQRMFEARRSRGGLDTWAPDPQASHDNRFGRFFVIPYIDACLAQRLGTPGTALMGSADMAQTWFGNTETLAICPADQYDGDRTKVAWLPNERLATMWKEFVTTGWVTDRTPPPAPTRLRASVTDPNHVTLRWQAEADLESGIKTFRIYRDGRLLAAYPGPAGEVFQKPNYHDTLDKPLREMSHTDASAPSGLTYTYQVTAVNWCDLESAKSKPVQVAATR